ERWRISSESRLMEASSDRMPDTSTQANKDTRKNWLSTMVQKISRSSHDSISMLRVMIQVIPKSSKTSTTTVGNSRSTRWRASEPRGIKSRNTFRLFGTIGIEQITETTHRLDTGARTLQAL